MRWCARTNVQRHSARRASRPQLKREPLGGALPPHQHSSVNSFGIVSVCGAPSAEAGERAAVRRAPPPQVCQGLGAPRPTIKAPAPQKRLPKHSRNNVRGPRGALEPSMKGAPSNTRLKLAAPGSWGKLYL